MNLEPIINHQQQNLFSAEYFAEQRTLATSSHTTKHIGDFWEEVARLIFNGQRTRICSGRNCPDLLTDLGYMEIKSVGKGRAAIINKDQLCRYIDIGATYAMFVHDLQLKADVFPITLHQLRECLAQNIQRIILVSARDLFDVIGDNWEEIPYCMSKNRGRAVFTGVRLPINRLQSGAIQTFLSFGTKAYSVTTKSFSVCNYTKDRYDA